MRAVKGRVGSARPASLSRAAAVMSAFAASENGAPRELAAYIRRASRAFDELLRLHREIRERRKGPDPEARADGSAGVDEDGTRNKKLRKRSDDVSNGDLIPRHADEDDSGGVEEEQQVERRRKKRRRRDGLDSTEDGELIARQTDGEDEGDEMRKKKRRKDGGELGIGLEKNSIGVEVENENIVEAGERPLEDREDGGSKKKKKKKRRGNEEGETGSNEKNVTMVEEKPEERKKRKEKKNEREKGLMEDGVGESLDDGVWVGGRKKRKHLDNGGGGDVLEDHSVRHKKKKKKMEVKEQ